MSLQNLFIRNNYKLFIGEVDIQNIVSEDLTVTNTITTNNINGNLGTLNTLNVANTTTTNNIVSNSGTINDLTVTDLTINGDILINGDLTIDNLNVNDTITADTIVSNNLTATTGNIQTVNSTYVNSTNGLFTNLTADVITTPDLTLDTITANSGIINALSCNSIQSNTALLNAATISYLTIDDEIVSCPSATITNAFIDNLTLTGGVTLPGNITCANLTATVNVTSATGNIDSITGNTIYYNIGNIDNLTGTASSFSNGNFGDLNVGNNIVSGSATINDITGVNLTYDTGYMQTSSTKELTIFTSIVSCPNASIDNLTVNTSLTAPSFVTPSITVDDLTINNSIVSCPTATINALNSNTINAITSVTVPLGKFNNIGTVSGSGNISFNNTVNSISFPVVSPFNSTPLNYCSAGSVNLTISAGPVNAGTIAATYTRIGPQITLHVVNAGFVSTGSAGPIIMTLPAAFQPVATCRVRGYCFITLTTTSYMCSYYLTLTGLLLIYGLDQPVGTGATRYDLVNINEIGTSTPIFTLGTALTLSDLSITYAKI